MKNFTRYVKILSVFLLALLTGVGLKGQTTLISPTGDGGFETGSTFSANGWTAVNDATNKWIVGTVSTPSSGANTAFISNDNGTTNAYTNTATQVSYFYRDVTIPAGESKITLSFKWKNTGESSFDRIFVFTGPTTLTPVANSTTLTGGTDVTGTTTYLSVQSAYQTATYTLPASLAGTTFRLIFGWRNDASGGGPLPGTVDDISLTSAVPSTYSWVATTGSASWATAASWSPVRTTPDASDILQFNAGGSSTVTSIPTQTVGHVVFSNNTTANFQSTTTAGTLTMGKLTVPSGSTLMSNGTGVILTLAFSAGAINPIGGRLEINNGVANAINFTNSVTTVTGTFALGGTTAATVTSSATTLLMNGTYEHKYTTISGTLPTATWADGSNCNIIGYTSTVTAHPSYAQSFWNFTWNCPAQTAAVTGSISGSWIVRNNLTLTATNTGSFTNSGTSTYAIKNIIMSGGTFNLGSSTATYTITGDFTKTGGTMTPTGACVFNFAGTAAQALSLEALAANTATWRFSNALGVTITGTGAFPTSFPIGNGTSGGVRISTTAAPLTFAGTITNGFAYNALGSTLTYDATGSLTARTIEFPATSGPANLTINVGALNVVTLPFSRSLAPTGASGVLTMTSGDIDISSSTLTLGTSAAFPGTLTWASGNVRITTGSMVRWFPISGLPVAAGTAIGYFPIANGANSRSAAFYFNLATALSAGGTIAVSHNATGGLAALSPTLTETQIMDKRTNATWSFTTGNGITASGTIAYQLTAGNLVTSATPANLHVIAATPALSAGLNVTGLGTVPNLKVGRSGLSVANLATPVAIGAASADVSSIFNSVASTAWSVPSTWDANAVPTSTDIVNITSGTNVSLDGANVASTLTVQAGGTLTAAANSLTTTTTITNNGTMNVSGGAVTATTTIANSGTINATAGTLTATGASATGITNSALATMNINGGTVTVGPANGSHRRFTNLGTLTVSSGTLNVNGNFLNTSSVGNIFTQSGGNINVDGNAAGVTANSVASATALAAFTSGTPTTVFLTGGTFTIVDPHAGTGTTEYALSGSMSTATNCSINHTFKFGDGVSNEAGGNASNGFYINSATLVLGNVIANGGTGTNRFVTTTSSSLGILGDLTINANSEYRVNSTTSYFASNIVNNGTLTNTSTIILGSYTNAVAAASTNAQTISGSGVFRNSTTTTTASMASLTVNNTNATGVTLNTPLSISGTFTLTSGLVNTSAVNLLQVGTATAGGSVSSALSATTMVVGPFARTFAASRATSGASSIVFPIGKAGTPMLLNLDANTAATGAVIFTGEAFATNTGTAGTGVSNLSTKTWSVVASTGVANLTNVYVKVTDANVTATSKLLHSATIGGTYDGTPGGSTSSGAAGTVTTSAPIVAASLLGNFAYGDLVACIAPTDAPTVFTKSLVTTTTFTGGFTAATSNPTGYLVVRYASGATPTTPADYTLYAASATLGTGTVLASYNTAPFTFNVTGLTANTTYDYYVYAFNNSGCAGPTYFATPLMGSVTTCAAATVASGTPTSSSITSSGFTASWTASSTTGVDYELDVATNSTFTNYVSGYQALNVGTGTLTYAITGLSPSTTYYTRVRALLGTCYSASSSTLTVATVAVPVITSISPNVCNGPATLTITGTGLTGATAANVTVGGTPVTAILTNTATSITATVAAGVSGTVSVTNPGGVAMSATSYSVGALGVVTVTPSVLSLCGTGGTTDLVAASPYGGYTYAWTSLTAGASLSAASGVTSTATLTATSDFQLVASDAGTGCTETVVTSIGVYPFPSTTMTATPNDSICAGSTVTLNSGLSAGNFSHSPITYAARTAPASAVNLASGGTATVAITPGGTGPLDDVGWGAIPIGFTYNFFGTNYTTLNVGSNGTLQFGAFNINGNTAPRGLADFTFTTFPSVTEPFSVVAVCANDNDLTNAGVNGGTVRYWTTGYAPNRVFVVEYLAVRQYNQSNTSTAQAHFFETTGIVEIHLQGSTSTNNKLVGLQNGDGTIGALALATTAAVTTPVAYRFSPPSNYNTAWSGPDLRTDTLTTGLNIFSTYATPTSLGTKTYQIVFTNTVTGCSNSTTPATINVTVLPTPVTAIASSPTICSGLTSMLTNTATLGATDTVKWYSAATGGTLLATGNTFTTPALTATTMYYAETNNVACLNTGGRVVVTVTISAAPVAQTLTGGGGYCVGGTGVDVGVTTTETGVNYQLRLDGNPTGSPVAGTGAAISFGLQTTSGTYTVQATNTTGGCTAAMTGSKIITVNVPPSTAVLAGPATAICTGSSANLTVTVTGGTSPYSVVYSGGTVPSYVSAANISVSPTTTTGYTLTSVTDANGCIATTPSGAPMITVDQIPTTAVAGSAQSAATTAFTLAGNTPSVGTGIWTVVSGDAGIAAPLSATSAVSMPVGAATLRWTITNGVCTASTSDVILTSTVAVANATTTSACQAFTSVTIDATNNNVWVPLIENGSIVAAIKANGNNLGTVSGSYFINTGAVRSSAGAKYMDRNIGISTQTPPSSAVSVRMYLTTAEWAALVAAVPAVADNAFSLTRLDGTCNTAFSGIGTIINGATIVDINGYRAIQFSTAQFSDFYVTEQNAVLPIELKSLTATAKGAANIVKWTTATELNVAEFIIERSANGRDAWTAIARTKAAGTTQTEQNYQVTDNEPLTLSYYRLRSVETSGKSEVSKTVAVKRNGGKLAVLMVSPNPTTEGVNVDFSTSKIGKLSVTVIDILGKVVRTETVTTVEGANLMRLDLSNLAQGTYVLTLNDGETLATQRVVKQ